MEQRTTPLALFGNTTFRSLWAAALLSNLGALIQAVGAGWLMTSLTESRNMVALVQASSTFPIMAFALLAGALADNLDKRRIMLVAQIFMLVVSVVLTLVAFSGMMTPWLLLAFTFLIGCGTALHNPSWQASMGDIVSRNELSSAVSLNSMGFNMMRSVGPAIGGFIVAVAGAAAAFAVNTLSYVSLIVVLLRWKPQYPARTLPREAMGRAVTAGLRYVLMSPNLMNVMFRGFLFGFAAVSVLALLPLVARNLLQGNALTYGILLGFFGIGAIFGALSNVRLRMRYHNEIITRGAFIGFAVSIAIVALSRDLWISCLALLVSGACWVLAMSLFNVTVQLSTPRWVVGRAIALFQTATFGGMTGGSWLWGLWAQWYGSDTALLASSVVLLIGALIGLWIRLPEYGDIDLDPLDKFSEPALRLDLANRSGPIMVMIDFEIAQEDVVAFLAVMADRRRMRLRDGARQWALLRDLENPRIWTESYHVPTWVEFVRHHQRRTKSDAEISERILTLHQGKDRPRVHHMIERQTVVAHDDMPIRQYPDVHH